MVRHPTPVERENSTLGLRGLRRRVAEAEGLIWRRQGKGTFIGALHRTIARLAGNRLLLELVGEVRRDAWRALRERARSDATAALYIRQHREIVAAVAAHDPRAAEAAMGEHIAALRRNVASFEDVEVEPPTPQRGRADGMETVHAR